MRRLFKNYPRHTPPFEFIVKFEKIKNLSIRNIVKRYYENMLSNWGPCTFNSRMKDITPFYEIMYELFPYINSFSDLERKLHIEPILLNIKCSQSQKRSTIKYMKSMFDYMYINKWENSPNTGLLNSFDKPKIEKTLPRPISPNIKIKLDDYIEKLLFHY